LSGEAKTAGILPETGPVALGVLQFSQCESREVIQAGSQFDLNRVNRAAKEVATYHRPDGDQAMRHQELTESLALFLEAIVRYVPPGPERSTAISRAREAKMWASAGVALEQRPEPTLPVAEV
jgi:hypothetical protein